MKEVWVKIECWRRHLIEDDEVEEVKMIMENDSQKSYDELISIYDQNKRQEYDNEKLLPKGGNSRHNVEIKDVKSGSLIWRN